MRQIDALTGLRLLAALAVFASHLPQPSALAGPASTLLNSGYNGVTLFFVLSGFVLTYTYADRLGRADRTAVRNFAVARFARIAPLYFAALAFVVLRSQAHVPDGAWMHFFALQTWSGDLDVAYSLNTPAWSIGVEVFLYATFPLMLWLMVRRARREVLWLVAGGVLVLVAITATVYFLGLQDLPREDPWSAHRLLYRTPLTRLPDFLLGVGIALLVLRSEGPCKWAPTVQWLSAATIFGLMCSDRVLFSIASWDLGYAVPFAALIWSLAMGEDAPLARLLGKQALVQGGVISYAFYLFHVPLLKMIAVDASTWESWLLTSAAALGLVVIVAAGAHVAIETPAQRWLRRRLSSAQSTGDSARIHSIARS